MPVAHTTRPLPPLWRGVTFVWLTSYIFYKTIFAMGRGSTSIPEHVQIPVQRGLTGIGVSLIPSWIVLPEASGSATIDTENWKRGLTEAKEGRLLVPPGEYKVNGNELIIPLSSTIVGLNARTSQVVQVTKGDLFRMGGESRIESLYVRSEVASEAGTAAFNLSTQNCNDCYFTDLRVGSNFNNAFKCVAEAGLPEIGGIHFKRIWVAELGTGVKSYGGAVFVLGSEAKRCVAVYMDDIWVNSNTATDVPVHFEINNTDSVSISKAITNRGEKAVTVGNADTSEKKTTNLKFSQCTFDGANKIAMELEKHFSTEITSCTISAAKGAAGIMLKNETSGFNLTGSKVWHCNENGIKVQAGVTAAVANTICGCSIVDNGETAVAYGILLEAGAGGFSITGNVIGNFTGLGGGKQAVGIGLAKGAGNSITITGNRVDKNELGQIICEAEGNNIKIRDNISATPNVYGAKTERATGAAITPSQASDTYVVLTAYCKESTKTVIEILVSGVVVAEQETSASEAGQDKITEQIIVPVNQPFEVKVKEGSVEKLFSSYLPL